MSAHDKDSNTGANIVIAVTLVGLALCAYMLAVWLL